MKDIFDFTVKIITIIVGLHKIFGKEKYLKGLKITLKKINNTLLFVGNSKRLFYIYKTLIVLMLAVSLLLGFLAGVLNVLHGKIITGFFAFSIIASASILFTYFNWKLSKRQTVC